MSEPVTIINKGRGPQLSSMKLTVQDLLPQFKAGETNEEILEWYPQIGDIEVDLLRQYYLDHTEEVLADEVRIAGIYAELRKQYHRPSELDSVAPEDRKAYFDRKIAMRRAAEANGDHRPAR